MNYALQTYQSAKNSQEELRSKIKKSVKDSINNKLWYNRRSRIVAEKIQTKLLKLLEKNPEKFQEKLGVTLEQFSEFVKEVSSNKTIYKIKYPEASVYLACMNIFSRISQEKIAEKFSTSPSVVSRYILSVKSIVSEVPINIKSCNKHVNIKSCNKRAIHKRFVKDVLNELAELEEDEDPEKFQKELGVTPEQFLKYVEKASNNKTSEIKAKVSVYLACMNIFSGISRKKIAEKFSISQMSVCNYVRLVKSIVYGDFQASKNGIRNPKDAYLKCLHNHQDKDRVSSDQDRNNDEYGNHILDNYNNKNTGELEIDYDASSIICSNDYQNFYKYATEALNIVENSVLAKSHINFLLIRIWYNILHRAPEKFDLEKVVSVCIKNLQNIMLQNMVENYNCGNLDHKSGENTNTEVTEEGSSSLVDQNIFPVKSIVSNDPIESCNMQTVYRKLVQDILNGLVELEEDPEKFQKELSVINEYGNHILDNYNNKNVGELKIDDDASSNDYQNFYKYATEALNIVENSVLAKSHINFLLMCIWYNILHRAPENVDLEKVVNICIKNLQNIMLQNMVENYNCGNLDHKSDEDKNTNTESTEEGSSESSSLVDRIVPININKGIYF